MSSVLERFRGKSSFQLITDAEELSGKLMSWFLNENNVPKRKRNLFQNDLKNSSWNLVLNIEKADYSYPSDEEKRSKRLEYINKAIENTTDLWYELRFIDNTLRFSSGIDLNKLEPMLTLLLKVGNSLKKWKEETEKKVID